MLRVYLPEHGGAALARDRVQRGVVRLVCQRKQRHDDRHDDALQRPEEHDAEERHDGPAELRGAYAADFLEFVRLDQFERVDDHHGRQHGLRHPGNVGCEQQHRRERTCCHHDARHFRTRPGESIDGRLRGAAARGHRPEKAADRVCRPNREQLAVRLRMRLFGFGECTSGRDRLGEAHERNAEGRRPQLLDDRQIG
jgi:hypothetical protein